MVGAHKTAYWSLLRGKETLHARADMDEADTAIVGEDEREEEALPAGGVLSSEQRELRGAASGRDAAGQPDAGLRPAHEGDAAESTDGEAEEEREVSDATTRFPGSEQSAFKVALLSCTVALPTASDTTAPSDPHPSSDIGKHVLSEYIFGQRTDPGQTPAIRRTVRMTCQAVCRAATKHEKLRPGTLPRASSAAACRRHTWTKRTAMTRPWMLALAKRQLRRFGSASTNACAKQPTVRQRQCAPET